MDIASIFEQHRTRNIFFALISWITAFIVYTITVSPTAPFWDPSEYIAVSHTLQVAHPPGSPFFALVGRLFSMFMPTEYVAWSINMISVVASAFTIMLLYLITIRLIEMFRGPLDEADMSDKIGAYGGAMLGAFTLMFSHTHWFNAVEAEMYASSTMLTAFVVWAILRWSNEYENDYSERWIILISYIFGIGIGVHLLNLLAIFFIALIIYFRVYEFSFKTFSVAVGASIAGFLTIYPVTIINLPNVANQISDATYGLIGPVTYIAIILGALIYGVYYTQKKGKRYLNLILLSYMMIMIGYSSYALIMIRSQAEPPIDENDPSALTDFVKYLSRDQYGTTPLLTGYTYNNRTGNIDRSEESLFPRRHSGQGRHLQYYSNFDSDWDFFWSYQVNHMYLRYFNWNFVGRDSDIQDASWYAGFTDSRHQDNPANSYYFFLPLILGLIGMIYHFQKDWKHGLSVLALFFLTGLAIIFYLNQTPYEPRERDYAYAGSFFAFSIWIGIGATALIELIKKAVSDQKIMSYGAMALMMAAVPVWMGYQNFHSNDRSGRYVARDYAYNLLNSVEENALIFTNGDNDTFPLWYIQEVEGVRTDVRVVNLSLLNTEWYIKQMRDRKTHESLPLPISLTDEEIVQLTSNFEIYDPEQITIPVDKQLLNRVYAGRALEEIGEQVTPTLENQIQMATPYSLPVEELDDEVSWFYQGRSAGRDQQGNERFYLQAQDVIVLEMLRENKWLRPIYFANTVASDGQLGLQDYFQFEGKAFRVVPKKRTNTGQFGYIDPDVHAERLSNFKFTEWNNPDVYFDENIRRMLSNYRYGFTQLADTYIRQGEPEEAAKWLKFGEEKIPFRTIENDWTIPVLYAYRYLRVDENQSAVDLSQHIAGRLKHILTYDIKELNVLEQEVSELDESAQRARANANMGMYQTYQQQLNRVSRQRENLIQEVSFSVSRLTILQHIFYQSNEQEIAEALAADVNSITQGRLQLPDSAEAAQNEVSRFGLGI
ncbi:glycosyltransferase family 117 protein [Rhodohalobacter sp. 8-1]|uniref:glycosyltransferase family 117 protein n=1 Tax=Rhodohalobacter sp. 8-1 TaxID=3131972 RepID=UPI0030EB17DD